MSEPFVFDSRSAEYKTPFGAVPCGQFVTFRCRPLLKEDFTHCSLIFFHEFSGRTQEVEMACLGPEGERLCFSAAVAAPPEPELSWYHFRLWRDDGTGCFLDKTGYRSDTQFDSWQLTTYRPTHTPEWFGSGVTYHIFPDRFRRLSVPKADGLVGNRWVHEQWDDMPQWQPDPDGEIRNRDFFGGSLAGITSKLDDLARLGVTTLYLCPIFESASNHRYNTADYTHIDPMLGTEKDFDILCRQARERGIHILLDGVFNHTGSQSIYFNADGYYPSEGAAQSQDSPYYDWYSFHPWPQDYDSWWGIHTLPAVREECPSYVDYIIDHPDSIVRRWVRLGASGWRLDVADELPDWFIAKIRTALEETDPEGILIGEVWEDGSNKIAYSQRRRYLLGSECHGLMNYPFRTALLAYLQGGGAEDFQNAMETIRENYPPAAFYSAMNFLGTHDTPRILTVLGADHVPETREARAAFRLSPDQRAKGVALVRLAALILFTFPGSPTIFYGDEAGMEGFEDPFNRGTYPWGHEDRELLGHFARLGTLRRSRSALQKGTLSWITANGPLLAFAREGTDGRLVTVVNTDRAEQRLSLPWSGDTATDLLTGQEFFPEEGTLTLCIPPRGGFLLG